MLRLDKKYEKFIIFNKRKFITIHKEILVKYVYFTDIKI